MKSHSWLFSKKRGNRRTDSQVAGLIAEVSLAVLCILAGAVGIVWIFTSYILPEWRVHKNYERTTCVLEDVRVVKKDIFSEGVVSGQEEKKPLFTSEEDGSLEASSKEPETTEPLVSTSKKEPFFSRLGTQARFYPELYVQYTVGGKTYKNWVRDLQVVSKAQTEEDAKIYLEGLRKGEVYYCWFDPEEPDNVVVSSRWAWENFCSLLIPFSLLVLGLGALGHLYFLPQLASKEYSAVAAQRAAHLASFDPSDLPPYPAVPDTSSIIDSPGIQLAYRLPMEDSPAWNLLILMSVTLLWNLFVLVHLTIFGYSLYEGNAAWGRLAFVVPFALVGVLMTLWTSKQVRAATLVGPTLVELDTFPIPCGNSAKLFMSQSGHLKMYWLNVLLVCEEEVVFTHGTNTRREIQRVFQRQLFCEESFEIRRAEPFEMELLLEIPQNVMHSFVSSHNQIKWKIIVQGAAANSPVFERAFPLIILPNEDPEKPVP